MEARLGYWGAHLASVLNWAEGMTHFALRPYLYHEPSLDGLVSEIAQLVSEEAGEGEGIKLYTGDGSK